MKTKRNRYGEYTDKVQKDFDSYRIMVIVLLSFFAVTILGLIIFTHMQTKKNEDIGMRYKFHYMFVSQAGDSYTPDRIYEEAKKYGREKDVYVEKMGDFSNADFEVSDYLKMAIAMKADGIILEGKDDDEVRESVNDANDQGIPVVTILSDCSGSGRKSFIELGDYNLGREYARLVIDNAKLKTPKVVFLMEEDDSEDESQIERGMKETLQNEGNHLDVQLRMEKSDPDVQFRISDKIKEILIDEETRPDILICMNEKDTKMVYQYLIDYNLTGDVKIIGSYVSESLIKAVRDGEIAALIDVDVAQAGMLCVDALNYYIVNGNVNDYIIVDDKVITSENVERYIGDE